MRKATSQAGIPRSRDSRSIRLRSRGCRPARNSPVSRRRCVQSGGPIASHRRASNHSELQIALGLSFAGTDRDAAPDNPDRPGDGIRRVRAARHRSWPARGGRPARWPHVRALRYSSTADCRRTAVSSGSPGTRHAGQQKAHPARDHLAPGGSHQSFAAARQEQSPHVQAAVVFGRQYPLDPRPADAQQFAVPRFSALSGAISTVRSCVRSGFGMARAA